MKKNSFINAILIFIISFPIHFLYELIPYFLTSIIAPVNESIFEHMKLIATSIFFARMIIYFIRKKQGLSSDNYIFKSFLNVICTIVIFLIFYLPTYYLFIGENMAITLILYFISLLISEAIFQVIWDVKLKHNYNLLEILLIVGLYILTTFLTYNPPRVDFFFDPQNKNYGIIKK